MSESKAIGTRAEVEVVKAFERAGMKAHRPALRGSLDHGDVWVADGAIVVEVKAGEQTRAPSWNQLRAWWAEAVVEAGRVSGEAIPLLVVRRWGSGRAEDWTVYHGALYTDEPVALRLGALLAVYASGFGA